MRKILFLVSLLALSPTAQAANIHRGDWEVGGTLAFSFGSNWSDFYANPSAQYFAADYFSLGLEGSYSAPYQLTSSLGLAPVASLYFPVWEKAVPFVSIVPISWNQYGSGSTYYSSKAKLGVKFFFTDSVAFGPALQVIRFHPRNGGKSTHVGSLLLAFSIHL